jgi:uncharacterized protein YlaI
MVHFSCDLCGKDLRAGEDHYVVRIEVFSNVADSLTEADLDEDHLEAVGAMIRDLDEDELEAPAPATRQFRYDLCPTCQKRFARDPLSKDNAPKFHFSEN